MSNPNKLTQQEIKAELWRRGSLKYKLDKVQQELYETFYTSPHKIQTWLLARRSGKTYLLCVLALEQCLRKPNSIVKIASPTKLQVNNNVRPIFRKILEDCPSEVKPEFREKDFIYYFQNGSEIQLAGSDAGHAEKLRGGDSDLWFVDEAGSCSDLRDVVNSILLPTTLTTKGKGVLASTPPKESDHDFLYFIEVSEQRNALTRKTIYDNPRVTKQEIDEMILELGGISNSATRRELFCEIIKDETTSVIPEFTPEIEKEMVKEWPKPLFYDCYESMDLGGKDLTVVLFAYYDFKADKVIVEDELIVDFRDKNNNIQKLTKDIKEKEKIIWTNEFSGETKVPYMRVSDINYIVTQEIMHYGGKEMYFQNAKKDDNDAAINTLRIMIGSNKIVIHPRCKTLIHHLKNVKWHKSKKNQFARSPDAGHYDAVDALKYLVRSIVYSKNPYPAHYNINKQNLHVQNPENYYKNDQIEIFKKIFNVPSKRRF